MNLLFVIRDSQGAKGIMCIKNQDFFDAKYVKKKSM